ncbi:MAG: hypothetical protein NTW38_04290 [Candidatus Aminicenantes bacterium]|nr:hypothetical protein [Candidatus Aminicenantes bacterium]
MNRLKGGFTALVAGFVLGAATPARGQIYFGISPIRAEHKIRPGGSLTDVFMIRNNDTGPIRIKVYCENWTISEDGTASFIGATPTTYSSKDWIIVNPQDFRMAPGETKSVRYTVTVPPDTAPGGYHAAISFETVPDAAGAQAGNRMLFSGKIAAAVYVLTGDPAVEGDLLDLTLGTKNDTPALVLALSNTGHTHFRTKGVIRIFSAAGDKIFDFDIPDDIVLPESRKNVSCPLPRPLEPGTYRAVCELDIGRVEIIEMEKTIEVEK